MTFSSLYQLTRKTVKYLLFETKTARIEFILGFFAVSFGFWLLLPPTTFAASHIYTAMAQVASEEVWGIVFFLIGLLQMHYSTEHVRHDGLYLRHRYFLSRAAVALWLFTTAMFAAGNFWATATAIYFAIALVTASVCITLGRRV